MTKLVPKISSKSAAPGQYLGYGLQDVRLCHHLLKAPSGHFVSLEFIEDTAIHEPTGKTTLEQAKSSLSGNPISDGSTELWKCFSNWAQLCAKGSIDPSATNFRLYACPPKEGVLVQLMHSASTEREAEAVLAKIEKKINHRSPTKGCSPLISTFINIDRNTCRKIIINFRLIMESDPLEAIREILRFSVYKDSLDDFCAHAIGAAKNEIATLIRNGDQPIIEAEGFRHRLQSFVRKHGILGLLVPTTEQPTELQIEFTLSATPVFVQQLIKIEIDREHVVRAVSDYLRADSDQTIWGAEGRVVKESFDELHNGLEAHFQITRDEIEDIYSTHNAEMRGRQIYRQCVKHVASLEGKSLPIYFVPGTYNALSDICKIGWHPNYKTFFEVS